MLPTYVFDGGWALHERLKNQTECHEIICSLCIYLSGEVQSTITITNNLTIENLKG